MKIHLINLKDISDSREVMEKKSPLGIRWFIIILCFFLVIAIIAMCILEVDEYVRITGMVETKNPISNVVLVADGKIQTLQVDEGDYVQKGDVLFTLNIEPELLQKKSLENKLSELRKDYRYNEKLKESVALHVNQFKNSNDEEVFYNQFEQYRISFEDTVVQAEKNNESALNSIKDAENSIDIIIENKSDVNKEIEEYNNLLNAIQKNQKINFSSIKQQLLYNDLNEQYISARESYSTYTKEYENLENSTYEKQVSQEELEQAYTAKLEAERNFEEIKSTYENEIQLYLIDLESQYDTYEKDYQKTILALNSIDEQPSNISLVKLKLKTDMLTTITNNAKEIQEEISSIEDTFEQLEYTIENSSYIANCDGIVAFLQKVNISDTLIAGTHVLQVIPDSVLTVKLYIPDGQISKVEIGQPVSYTFESISYLEYGSANGKVCSISASSTTNDNYNYVYIGEAAIEQEYLINKEGEISEIKVGMLTDVKIISGSKKVIIWLLEKLNLWD